MGELYDNILNEMKKISEIVVESSNVFEPKHVGIFEHVRYSGHIIYKLSRKWCLKKPITLDFVRKRLTQNTNIPEPELKRISDYDMLFYKKDTGVGFYDEVFVSEYTEKFKKSLNNTKKQMKCP